MKAFLISLALVTYAHAAFASCGTFEVSKGDVKVQPVSGAAVAAAVGAKICAGDTVIAGESARAKIKMEDGNELNISPNSKIVLEAYQYDAAANKKKVMLNVLRGKVRATTKEENMYNDKAKDGQANTFQIRTKSAVAGVRGTDFLTSFDGKKMEVVTFRGKVEVGTLGAGGKITNSVFVAVGQRTEVVIGKAPDVPRAMPAGELMKQNNETHNESSTQSSSTAQPSTAKSDDKKSGDDAKRTPASGGSATAGSAVANGPTSGGTGSMISANDMPATTTNTDMPKLPPVVTAPAPPVMPVLPQQVINAIANQKANVNLQLHINKRGRRLIGGRPN